MHEDENNFHKLWMTTEGNLSVEIRYQKLKVNFICCFRHGILQNQGYNFFCIISWVVSCSSFTVRFVCFFLRISCHSNVYEKLDFCFTDFGIAMNVFAWPTLHKSRQTLPYMWKFTREKDIGEREVHNPVKECTFYQYHQRFTVLHSPKICMKCCLLMNTASKRNI